MVPDMDQRFGPQLAGHFDVTLLFEQTIFEIAPNSVFVLATPFFLKSIASHAAKQVRPGPLLWAKMALGALLLAAYIAKAALWQTKSKLHSQASITSSIISLVTSLCTLVVIYSAHVYRRRPSTFMSVFFSITMLLDMALTRSYFLRHGMGYSSMQSIAAIQIVVVVVKLLLVVMEEVPKTTPSRKENVSSYVRGDSELGFWGKALFFSVSPLLLFGYKNELGVENLPPLDEQFESRVLFDAFFKHWSKLDRDGKFVLLRACLRTILGKFLAMVIPRLCYAAFSLSRPFLIQRVLEVVNSGSTTYQHATGLIGAAILIYAGIAISRAIFERIQYQFKVSIRGIRSVALFDKMQKLSIDEKQSAAAITLMTTDVMGVEAIIALLHEVWVTCLELRFGVYILYMFVDVACFLIFIPSILATISTYYSAKNMAKARGQWNTKISDRVQATSTVLNQLKDIKAMGLSHSISDYLQKERKEEVIVSLRERRSRVIMFATYKLLLEKSNNFAIRMEDVVVRSEHGRDILKSVNLSIPPGSLAMMHGTVGSGKSVFLQTLLGEVDPSGGKVSIMSNDISFAAQKPWIQNLTIRENIIGAKPVVESLYKEIIHGCALDIDIAELPSADETMCGTDGCNLSGGQKQRLGLARSLYSNASIVILDDVLSALDTSTAAAVFRRLFGPGGFLRRRGTTVIMTTNRLDFLPAADIVLEMKGDGTIDERRGADMPSLAEFAPSPAASASNDTCRSEKEIEPIKSTTASSGAKVDKMRRNGDVSLYAYLFRSAGPLLMSLWILGTAVASVAEKMPKIFIKIWYSNDPDNDTYFVGFAMTALANILLTAITTLFYFIMIVPNLSNELHWRLLNATVESTLSWITQTDTGTSLNRFSQDISIISQQLPIALLQFLFILCNTLVDVGIFAAGAKYAAPIVLMLLVALYGVQYFYLRTSRQLRLLDLETSAPLLTHFKEASAGMQHLRAFRWQETFMKECCRLVDRMQKPYYALLSVQQWLALVLDISTCFIATILIAVSTTLPNSTSDTSVGLALINLISFSIMTSALIRVWVALETCLGGLARIRTFCATTPQETDGPSCSFVPEQWPSSGRIEIESISASYTYEDGTLHQALDNANVVIEHGEKAGISGRTGSGKSSLFLALLHMIDCTGGTIRIDGRDITTIPREVLRSRITVLTQDGVEVEHSVRFNMYPFDDHQPTDESILETLDLVGLSERVQSQGGVEASMASMQFSPGQKQLFFVARGILHHKSVGSKIVMMDEATSSMDYGVDRQIQKLIDEQLTDCTIVLIAHRLHSLDNADVVVKLEAGKVVEVA
ncbi:hypothetical protein NHJ6243_007726 [Beauveria neobassiana]